MDDEPESVVTNSSTLIHPINHINDLNDDIFGHFDVDDLPSASKRQKIVRRMNKKMTRITPIPEPAVNEEKRNNTTHHSFNDFIKLNNTTNTLIHKLNTTNKTNSKWDIKDSIKVQCNTRRENTTVSRKKIIGCQPKSLYTIKDNKIVRLEKKHGQNVSKTSMNDYNLVDIKLPINESEKKILEGTKLSLDDIKAIPKFHNYEPGTPSKVLFLKNFSNNIKENNIKNIFDEYGKFDIRLMTGKMRGQAFITFDSTDIATNVLNEKNGIIVDGKPIIIQFGKRDK